MHSDFESRDQEDVRKVADPGTTELMTFQVLPLSGQLRPHQARRRRQSVAAADQCRWEDDDRLRYSGLG